MNALQQALSGLQLGEPLTHEGLTVHPLICAGLPGKDYLTLDEALQQNVARVTEVSESGSVPQLLFRNQGDQAVFLLDGASWTATDGVARIFVLFDGRDPDNVTHARQQWRVAKEAGLLPTYWRQGEDGRWAKNG